MAKDFAAKFRIKPGTRAHLGKRDAADASAFPDRKAAEQQSAKDGAVINEWPLEQLARVVIGLFVAQLHGHQFGRICFA